MSIAAEISRIQGLRNAMRTKLVSLGLVQTGAPLETCVAAVEGVEDRGAVSGTISSKDGAYTVPKGYHNGKGAVSIAGQEQAKLLPGNIKAGVTVLGVVGTYSGEGVKLQAKTITPTKAQQQITADEGYDALSQVTVEAIPSAYADVSGVTAEAADVLANKIIVGPDGQEIAGTMPNNGAVTGSIDGLTVTSYTIPAGYHSGAGKVSLGDDIERALAAI